MTEVTGLFLASISENEDGGEEIVRFLKDSGYALKNTSSFGALCSIAILHNSSADIDVELEPEGYTPLFIAVIRGKERMVRYCVRIRACVRAKHTQLKFSYAIQSASGEWGGGG